MVDASVLIVGAGAIGGVTAGSLSGYVHDLAILDADRAHVESLRDPGLRLDKLGLQRVIPLDAYADPALLEHRQFDFILLAVKAPHLELAVRPVMERSSTFVSLGNGLIYEELAGYVGRDRLVVAIVEWGATNRGPGHLVQTTEAPFVIGELDGVIRQRTRLLAEVLDAVAPVRISTNIIGHVWSKLLLNSAFSGLGAVTGFLYRDVARHAVGREVAYRLWAEGVAVARAKGIMLERVLGISPDDLVVSQDDDRRRADESLERMMHVAGAVKASMLQDLERGRPTEVDVINGAVVDQGRRAGVATPFNELVVELVYEMERNTRRPSPDALAEFEPLLAAGPQDQASNA